MSNIQYGEESLWEGDTQPVTDAFVEAAAPMIYIPKSGFNVWR